jgi:hypothetical protein
VHSRKILLLNKSQPRLTLDGAYNPEIFKEGMIKACEQ